MTGKSESQPFEPLLRRDIEGGCMWRGPCDADDVERHIGCPRFRLRRTSVIDEEFRQLLSQRITD